MYKNFMFHIAFFFNVISLLTRMVHALHPDTFLSIEVIVEKYGYPFENHEIITKDGYIITMYRIPHGKNGTGVNRKPILMMHGIMNQAESYIINGINNGSWAYEMADNGYDVWLGNTRGTQHGMKHLVLCPKDKEFWNYSLQEIALYDLPAMIDYILQTTKKSKLFYIGFSQGCTIFYIMCSLRGEYQTKIILASLLAPSGYMKYFSYSLIVPFTVNPKKLQHRLEKMGIFEVFSTRLHHNQLLFIICTFIKPDQCVKAYHSTVGGRLGEFNDDMLPLVLRFLSSGSIYQLLQYCQQINSGHFRPLDYGLKKNLEIYGKPLPDDYPIEKIEVPIAMYYSRGDTFVNDKDVEETCDALPNCVRRFVVPDTKWNHLDLLFSVHLKKDLIEPVVKFFQEYKSE